MRIGFIGCGSVGGALALGLTRAGHEIAAVSSRHGHSARALAARVSGCQAVPTSQAVVDAVDLVFLAVPDDVIAECASALVWRPGIAVVHCSGAHSIDILDPVVQAGGVAGGFHPLQTFTRDADAVANLTGSAIAIEADMPLLATLSRLADDLGCTPIHLRPGDKPLYHAAAAIISNYTVALTQIAADLWGEFGVPPAVATQALLPLLEGTVRNIARAGLPAALTGPIARGDTGTIRRHLAALGEWHPEALEVYRALGKATVPIALAKGSIGADRAEDLFNVLEHRDRPIDHNGVAASKRRRQPTAGRRRHSRGE